MPRQGDVRIGVRPATTDDTDELARLRWDFRVEHGTPVTRTFEEFATEFRAFVTDALAGGARWRAWVAHADGRLVGWSGFSSSRWSRTRTELGGSGRSRT